ncbi:MAG TPA: periplasmic heavy metal sensor [Pyrinomonadaceae bacterium]|nr:periplasmic heavy metal sensor [Pyrinomonadaceae bacterium]
MSRWKAQRPVAVQGTPGQASDVESQKSGPDQRESGRRGSAKQVGGVGMLLHHVDDFGLNDNQIEQLNKMMLTFELEKVDLQAALQKAKITWRALIRDVDANEVEVMAAIDNVSRAEANLRKMRYNHLKAARGVLEPAQQNNLRTFHLQQSRQKVGAGTGGGGGGGGQRRAG